VREPPAAVRWSAARSLCAAAVALATVVMAAGCTPRDSASPPASSSAPPSIAVPTPGATAATSGPVPSVGGSPIQIPTTAPSSSPTSAPRPTPTASKTTKPARSVAAFLSPSKNIECGRAPAGDSGQPAIACQIFERTFTKPACPSRPNQAPSSIVVYLTSKQRPNAVPCVSDVVVPGSPRAAAYGDRFAFKAGTACTVMPANVRCTNAAGHGFTLSRSALRMF
jgi:hypothetical protein